MKIGIGITTHNRTEILKRSLRAWVEKTDIFNSNDVRVSIVDDGSDQPAPYASFRFKTTQGISIAKNKCLEALDDCDHIFIVDDDIFPIQFGWEQPYINSQLNHACYTFGRAVKSRTNEYIEYEKPCGLMMYFKREVIEVVGGWDTDFKGYGYEHVNLSDRIFNAGLTPARYIDVVHDPANPLFYSHDQNNNGKSLSVVSEEVRCKTIPHNYRLYTERYLSKEFKPYK